MTLPAYVAATEAAYQAPQMRMNGYYDSEGYFSENFAIPPLIQVNTKQRPYSDQTHGPVLGDSDDYAEVSRYYHAKYPPSTGSLSFLHPDNVRYIQGAVASMLSFMMQYPVRVNMDYEVQYEMVHLLEQNRGILERPGIRDLLNNVIVGRLVHSFYYALRDRNRFVKYAIYWQDQQPWNRPVAEMTRQPRGEAFVSTAEYTLSHPYSKWSGQYIEDQWRQRNIPGQCMGTANPGQLLGNQATEFGIDDKQNWYRPWDYC